MIKKPVVTCTGLSSKKTTNVGPADHFPVPSSSSVAVGNWKTGPRPQTMARPGANSVGVLGEKKNSGVRSPQAELGAADIRAKDPFKSMKLPSGEDGRLRDHRQDRSDDQVPILIEVDWIDRLNVEDVLRIVRTANVKVGIVPKGDTDQIADRILGCRAQVFPLLRRARVLPS